MSVFGALSPERFSKVYQAWAELISLRLGPEGKHSALLGGQVESGHTWTSQNRP
ncbi:MAG: hypothetical protein IPG96_16525 [Proteobacteria bacterium]|nr:hypothetical protein [Pseudomonadota bacterium]